MDNDENYDDLIAFYINNEIKKHSAQKVISQEEFLKEIIQATGFSEEKILEVFRSFNKVIRELYNQNLEWVKTFFRERFGADLKMFDT